MKSLLRIFSAIVLVSFVLVGIWILIWWMPWMSFETPWYNLTETYLTIWDYSIWKQKFQYNICHKSEGCLDWKILGLQKIDENIYMYYKLNYSTVSSVNDLTNKETIRWYNYELLKFKGSKFVDNLDLMPQFFVLSWNTLQTYSNKDSDKLPKEKQNILSELVKSQRIIINNIDYSAR